MKKRYEWRVLTRDGLLKEPCPSGPRWDSENLNCYGGFSSDIEAIEAYADFAKRHNDDFNPELVLVCFYSPC